MTAPWASSSTGDPEASGRGAHPASTPGSSSAGVVLGIAQTVVNPPWAAAASPDATVSASSLPGLAQVRVQVDEPGRDDDPGRIDAVRVRALQPGHGLEDAVADDELAGAFPAASRIDQPGAAQVEVGHRRIPRDDVAPGDGRDERRAPEAAWVVIRCTR